MLAIVIPSYRHELTHDLVRQIMPQSDFPHRIVVVDNFGGYRPVADEMVLGFTKNLGYIRSNNRAAKRLLRDDEIKAICFTNDDIRISRNFFSTLYGELRVSRAGILSPAYDCVFEHLHPTHCKLPIKAEDYEPNRLIRKVPHVDGTVMAIRCETLLKIGLFDEEHFGTYSWGDAVDYCIRLKRAGMSVCVTEAAFCNHLKAATANQLYVSNADYEGKAWKEYLAGMTAKYGPDHDAVRLSPSP